jgi:hypothetical protein
MSSYEKLKGAGQADTNEKPLEFILNRGGTGERSIRVKLVTFGNIRLAASANEKGPLAVGLVFVLQIGSENGHDTIVDIHVGYVTFRVYAPATAYCGRLHVLNIGIDDDVTYPRLKVQGDIGAHRVLPHTKYTDRYNLGVAFQLSGVSQTNASAKIPSETPDFFVNTPILYTNREGKSLSGLSPHGVLDRRATRSIPEGIIAGTKGIKGETPLTGGFRCVGIWTALFISLGKGVLTRSGDSYDDHDFLYYAHNDFRIGGFPWFPASSSGSDQNMRCGKKTSIPTNRKELD